MYFSSLDTSLASIETVGLWWQADNALRLGVRAMRVFTYWEV